MHLTRFGASATAEGGGGLKPKGKKLVAVFFACMIAGAFSAPAISAPLHPKPKCNAGSGNASESTPENDCDPGNSVNNNGGD